MQAKIPVPFFLICFTSLFFLFFAQVANAASEATLDPTEFNFGEIEIGISAESTLTVTNDGDTVLRLYGMFSMMGDCTAPSGSIYIQPTESADLTITCTPSAIGPQSGSIYVGTNVPGSSAIIIPVSFDAVPPANAPVINIAPSAINTSLLIGSVITETFTITNSGLSDLSFTISENAHRVTVAPASGTVAPSGVQTVVVTIDLPAGAFGGSYSDALTIVSNDPINSSQSYSVSYTGLYPAQVVLDQKALDFGYLVAGDDLARTFTVSNGGDADLIVSDIASSDPSVTVTPTLFTLGDNDTQLVTVTYAPSAEAHLSGTLTISSNGVDAPDTLALRGTSVVPTIDVAPATLDAMLLSGEQTTRTVTVTNNGATPFSWNLRPTVAVAGYSADSSAAALSAELGAYFNFIPVGDNYTATTLSGYDIVLVSEFSTLSNAELDALEAVAVEETPLLFGRSDIDQLTSDTRQRIYNLFGVTNASDVSWNASSTLNDQHPINFGLFMLGHPGGGAVSRFDTNGATWLNDMGGNHTAFAKDGNGRTVILGSVVSSWLTVAPDFVANTLHWLASSGAWLDTVPASGVIAPAMSQTLTVALDATGVAAGVHGAIVTLYDDNPYFDNPTVNVSLTVGGEANIYVEESEIDFGTTFVGIPVTYTLLISNTGASPLTIYGIDIDEGDVFADPLDMVIPGLQAREVELVYEPNSAEYLETYLLIESDDPDTPDIELDLYAEAVEAPIADIQPPSVTVTQPIGTIVTYPITITNQGAGELTFYISGSQSWIMPDIAGGYVDPFGTQVVSITINATNFLPQTYLRDLLIETNDPDLPSQMMRFTVHAVDAVPDKPVYAAPANNASDVALKPVLDWDSVPYSDYVEVYLWESTTSEPITPTATLSAGAHNYRLQAPLDTGTTYSWRVIVGNAAGEAAGDVWQFTTQTMPDLTVHTLIVPNTGFAGQEVQVDWVVTNAGDADTTSSYWYDRIYISPLDTFAFETAFSVGYAQNVSYLAAGESYANSAVVTLPEAQTGNFYIHVVADPSDVMDERNETNNWGVSAAPMLISLPPLPDLQVANLQAPANAFSGEGLTIEWDVENAGTGPAEGQWQDWVYLSADDVLDATDQRLSSVYFTDDHLAAGETYEKAAVVGMPVDIFGTYYLIVMTDRYDDVFENSAENNNVSTALAVEVTLSPPPDLEVTYTLFPTSTLSGRNFEYAYRVTNNGAGRTRVRQWYDYFYLSDSAEFNQQTATFLDVLRIDYEALAPGDSYLRDEVYLGIPNGISGTQYIHVWTDTANDVYEFDADDNNIVSIPIEVTLAPSADLQVTSVTAPISATAGTLVEIDWVITNHGDPVQANWQDAVYLSADAQWDGSDILIEAFDRPSGLGHDDSYQQSRTVVIPPDLPTIGNYTLIVQTDSDDNLYEHNGEGNNIWASTTIDIHSFPGVDLDIMALPASVSGGSGQALPFYWSVKNEAPFGTIATSWRDQIYLSDDAVLDPFDELLLAVYQRGALDRFGAYTLTHEIPLPDGISGNYHLILAVDGAEQTSDNNRLNNTQAISLTISLTPPPDLGVAFVAPPTELIAGQPITLSWSVQNSGSGAAEPEWIDRVYLSADTVIDYRDRRLGYYKRHSPLAAGGSYTIHDSVIVPNNVSGAMYLIAETDTQNRVYEHGADGNNHVVIPVTVNVPLPSDLIVNNIALPANARPGEEVTISYSLLNQGEFAAVGRVCDGIYISADSTWDLNDALLTTHCRNVEIGTNGRAATRVSTRMADSNALGSLVADLPGVAPGSYYAIVRADIFNNIPESDETNNDSYSAKTLTVDIAALTVGTPTTSEFEGEIGHYYRIASPADVSSLLVTLDTASDTTITELYVRHNALPSRAEFDFSYAHALAADHEVVIPIVQPGDYYVLAYHNTAATSAYTLTVDALNFGVISAEPETVGNAGSVTLLLRGTQFSPDAQFDLIAPDGTPFAANELYLIDTSELYATFDLTDAPVGQYTLRATAADGNSAELHDAVTVQEGNGPLLHVEINGPDGVRAFRNNVFYINYTNAGDADVPAPIFLLYELTGQTFGLLPNNLLSETIRIMGINAVGPAGILPPGVTHSVPVYFFTETGPPEFELFVIEQHDDNPFDWEAAAGVRPDTMGSDVWDIGWPNVQAQAGGTWGDVSLALADVATLLGQRGERTHDVERLFAELVNQGFGYSTSLISGQLVDAQTGEFLIDTDVTLRAELPNDTYVIRRGRTDAQGQFAVPYLPPASYQLFVEGYVIDPTPVFTTTAGSDVTNLYLSAEKLIVTDYPTIEDPIATDDAPVLATDDAGNLHMVWQRDGELWYSTYISNTWTSTEPISGAVGIKHDLSYNRTLLGGDTEGLALVWQMDVANQAQLQYAVADTSFGITTTAWTAAQTLTSDPYGDSNPAVLAMNDDSFLATWQQRDHDNYDDDFDLYFDEVGNLSDIPMIIVVIEDPAIVAQLVEMMRDDPVSCTSLGIPLKKSASAPSWIPVIGGRYGLSFGIKGCTNLLNECVDMVQITGDVEVEMADIAKSKVELSGQMLNTAQEVDRICQWVMAKAQAQFAATLDIEVPTVPWKYFKIGFKGAWQATGNLTWTDEANFPLHPDEGKVSLLVAAGVFGKADVEVAELAVAGTAVVAFYYKPLDNVGFEKLCVKLDGGARVLYYKYETSWEIICITEEDFRQQGRAAFDTLNDDFIQGTEVLTVTVAPIDGTGAVYEGTPVLSSTISSDLTDDLPATMAVNSAGEVLSTWAKVGDDPNVAIGSKVLVSSKTVNGWDAPVTIADDSAFNFGPQVVFDSNDEAIVVWASAPATVTLASPIDEVRAALQNTDIVYATRSGGVWSAPQSVATLSGRDYEVRVSADSQGNLFAAWINDQDGRHTIQVAQFDGTTWTQLPALPSNGRVSGLDIAMYQDAPFVIWSDLLIEETETLGILRYTEWTGSAWTTVSNFVKPTTAARSGQASSVPGIAPSEWGFRNTRGVASPTAAPPEGCCGGSGGGGGGEDEFGSVQDPSEFWDDLPPLQNPDLDPSEYKPDLQFSADPNDIIGPAGYGDAHWVAQQTTLGYTIRFENDPLVATAPAQAVYITQQLDDGLDIRTFRLGTFGFGGHIFEVPANRAFYTTRLDLQEEMGLLVDVFAGINVVNGTAFWQFKTIDPATGAPPVDAQIGFLPPNVTAPEGDGFVTYAIQPATTITTGSVIDAEASIIFDDNDPIETPPIFNTIDAGAPTAQLTPQTREPDSNDIILSWTASDDAGGSGMAAVDIYCAIDTGAYDLCLADIPGSVAVFTAEEGHLYSFYAVARDNTGNREVGSFSAEITVETYAATAAQLDDFTVTANTDGSVTLDWQTSQEVDHAGFNLYRRLIGSRSAWVKINDTLISSQGGEAAGATYQFVDTNVPAGAWEYMLEDVKNDGETVQHAAEVTPTTVLAPTASELSGMKIGRNSATIFVMLFLALLSITLIEKKNLGDFSFLANQIK